MIFIIRKNEFFYSSISSIINKLVFKTMYIALTDAPKTVVFYIGNSRLAIFENYIQLFSKKIQPKYLNNIIDVSSNIMN